MEMIRGAVLWTIWLEINCLCFYNGTLKLLRSTGLQILTLVSFWCQHATASQITNLPLTVPLEVQSLPLQVNTQVLAVMGPLVQLEDHLFGNETDSDSGFSSSMLTNSL
jgi:hypothetical protein